MRQEVSTPRRHKLVLGCPPPRVLTDGVVTLRLPGPGDMASLMRYGEDESLRDGVWIVGPRDGESMGEWASRTLEDWTAGWTDEGGMDPATLIADEVEPFIGVASIFRRGETASELNYGVAPHVRERGIATRILRLASDWALTHFDRLELRIAKRHETSRRVAEKAGFRHEETFETFVTGTGRVYLDTLYVRDRP